MTGAHLADQAHRVQGMRPGRIKTAKNAWAADGERLGNVAEALTNGAPAVLLAFGADSATGQAAQAAFTRAATTVQARADEMTKVGEKLEDVIEAMVIARGADKTAPTEPDELPPPPVATGVPLVDLLAAQQYHDTKTAHTKETETYAGADEDARLNVERIKITYAAASAALAEIHGDPTLPTDGNADGPGNTGGPSPRPVGSPTSRPPIYVSTETTPTHTPPTIGHHVPDPPTTVGPPYDHGVTVPTPGPTPGYDGPDDGPWTPTSPGTPGSGFPSATPGIAAAGLLGAPGLIKGISSLTNRGAFGAQPGTIGSSSRVGSPGTLGRSGAMAPGSPVARGGAGGRGAAGGRGGAAGSPTGRGKGGRAGGRAGIGAGVGGKGGRKRDDEDAQQHDLWDDGSDWLDDEGMGSAVLD